MRINIEVPDPSSSSHASTSFLPLPLAQLAPSGELVLIELQGSLDIDNHSRQAAEGGQVLGKLEFHQGREDKPTLMISHHRLEGKIVSLTKPFAVLEKKKRQTPDGAAIPAILEEEEEEERKKRKQHPQMGAASSSPLRPLKSNNGLLSRHGEGEEEEDEGIEYLEEDENADALASPSMARKRARLQGRDSAKENLAIASDRREAPFSSSPAPKPPMRGSELDFSSPLPTTRTNHLQILKEKEEDGATKQVEGVEDEEWMHKKNTLIYYDVVCIIRKKILFSKRPEPVVRLDGEGGEKAKAALGL